MIAKSLKKFLFYTVRYLRDVGFFAVIRLKGRAYADRRPLEYRYLSEELALAKLRTGRWIYVDPLDESMSAQLITHGVWEQWVEKPLKACMRPGSTVLEVGANLGYYTLMMAEAVGNNGKIIAIDANPRMVSLVNKSLYFNGFLDRAEIRHAAATDVSKNVEFTVSRRGSGWGHTIFDSQDVKIGDWQPISVEGIRLDDICDRADIIRMDAEGSEGLILKGAERILKNPDLFVFMEWSPIQISSRSSVPDLVDRMAASGFEFYKIRQDSKILRLDRDQLINGDHCEIIMTRRLNRGLKALLVGY